MWNEPTDDELALLPPLYATESIPPQDKIICQHYFLGGCDWCVAEYGPAERNFVGYAILNDDLDNAEWGYISVSLLWR